MTKLKIQLDTIDKIKDFVQKVTRFDCDFDMCSGRYTVDAKSILGIFSLDLAHPIDLIVYDDAAIPEVKQQLGSYLLGE